MYLQDHISKTRMNLKGYLVQLPHFIEEETGSRQSDSLKVTQVVSEVRCEIRSSDSRFSVLYTDPLGFF